MCCPHKTEKCGLDDMRWGHFQDLEAFVGLGFKEARGINNILAKTEGGVFIWSKRSSKKLKEVKVNGAEMKTKQLHPGFACTGTNV